MTPSEQSDSAYGNAVVVTVTFKGPQRFEKAERLEADAKRIGHNGIFTEQVEVDGELRRN